MVPSSSASPVWYPNSTLNTGDRVYIWGMQFEYNTTSPQIYQPEDILGRGYATFAKREDINGNMYVADSFDEFTGAPVVDGNLMVWVDAGQISVNPTSGSSWTDLSGNGKNYDLTPTAALTYVASAVSVQNTGSSTIVVAVPSGISNGQLMLMILNSSGTASTWTTPAGWAVGTAGANGRALFWKIASSEPGSYTVGQTISGQTSDAVILVYANAAFDTSGLANQATVVTTVTPVAITVAKQNSSIVYVASGDANVTFTTPTGYTLRASDSDVVTPSVTVWDLLGAVGAGSYSAPTTNGSGASGHRGYVIALYPAASVFSSFNPTFGGGAITFGSGASSQYATTAASLFNSTTFNSYTMSLWAYPTGAGNFVQVDGQAAPNTGYVYSAIEVSAGGTISFGQWTGSLTTIATSARSLNAWYNLGITYNGTTATAYVNGVSVGSTNISWSSPGANTFMALMAISVTNMGTGANASGSLGQFMVYNRGLTVDEVQTNFNALRGRYGI
jgi:hypothetical protein